MDAMGQRMADAQRLAERQEDRAHTTIERVRHLHLQLMASLLGDCMILDTDMAEEEREAYLKRADLLATAMMRKANLIGDAPNAPGAARNGPAGG